MSFGYGINGVLGHRSGGLRIQDEFSEDTAAERNILVVAHPGLHVTGWGLHSSNTYRAVVRWPFFQYGQPASNDAWRNIVAVAYTPPVNSSLAAEAGLSRADSIASCVATAGTYFYDLTDTMLYIHLLDDSNPNLSTVVPKFGFYFSSRAAIHPDIIVSPYTPTSILTNGNFESLAGWTELVDGAGGATALDTVDFKEGASSLKCTVPAAVSFADRERTVTTIFGKTYRMSGFYKTVDLTATRVLPKVRVGTPFAGWIDVDGRTYDDPVGLELASTGGEWQRFVFDFMANDTTTLVRIGAQGQAGPSNGSVNYDDVQIRLFERYNFFEPRISASSIPNYDVGVNDTLSGGHRVGVGSLTLNNGDGSLEPSLGGLIWENAGIRVYHAGKFADGTDVTFDDARLVSLARIQSIEVSDREVVWTLEDFHPADDWPIPFSSVLTTEFPLADPNEVGKPRPLLFGKVTGLAPVKIDTTARIYEICHTKGALWNTVGIKAVDAVYAYDTEEAANNEDTTLRTTLVLTTDYTVDLLNGRITIVDAADDHFIRVDAQGFKDDGAGSYTGTASALISLAPDITRFIFGRVLFRSGLDAPSFAAARITSSQPLGIYLRERISVREVFNRIEQSVLATIVMDGSGALFFIDVSSASPVPVATLKDVDFMTWTVEKRVRDIYRGVEVRYDQRGSGDWRSITIETPSVPIKYLGKGETLTLDTYLIQKLDAEMLAGRLAETWAQPPRRIRARVHGRLFDLKLGQAVTVTRARGLGSPTDPGGLSGPSNALFRVSQMNHSFDSNITEVELLEVNIGPALELPASALMPSAVVEAGFRRRRRSPALDQAYFGPPF